MDNVIVSLERKSTPWLTWLAWDLEALKHWQQLLISRGRLQSSRRSSLPP